MKDFHDHKGEYGQIVVLEVPYWFLNSHSICRVIHMVQTQVNIEVLNLHLILAITKDHV